MADAIFELALIHLSLMHWYWCKNTKQKPKWEHEHYAHTQQTLCLRTASVYVERAREKRTIHCGIETLPLVGSLSFSVSLTINDIKNTIEYKQTTHNMRLTKNALKVLQ